LAYSPRLMASPPATAASAPSRRKSGLIVGSWLACLTAVGAYLRLWHVGSQIPFDDEWHSLAYIVDHDLDFLLTHYTRLGANSVLHNLYLRLAFQTVGLDEWSIALPSLVAGILLVWIFPRWLAKRLGLTAGIVCGLMLALSPFLIFYSRFARPYALLLLFEGLAILFLIDWTRGERRAHGALAILFGVLAVWTHLTAIGPLLGAWTAAVFWQWRASGRPRGAAPGPLRVVLAAGLLGSLGVLVSLPAILQQANPADPASAPFTLETVETLSQLLFGTALAEPRLLLVGATVAGCLLLARRVPREFAILAAAAWGGVLPVVIGHPQFAEIGAIFARYCLPLFLVVPMAVGAAAQWLMEQVQAPILRRVGGVMVLGVLGAALYYAGPIPVVFTDHASFTKHPAFQYQYEDITRARSLPDPVFGDGRPLFRRELHPFYEQLAKLPSGTAIIEYPFTIGQDANRLYYAQMIHRQPVLAGYYSSGAGWFDRYGLALDQARATSSHGRNHGFLMTDMTIDHALGPLADRSGIRFRTVVDLADPQAIRASGATYVVLHWNPAREFLRLEIDAALGATRGRFVATLRDRLAAELGPPILEDDVLTVFAVR
jgi:MFS family permease